MFTDGNAFTAPADFSALGSTDRDVRHLINRLRLEFRTASQRQLEEAVEAAARSTNTYSPEKILQVARATLAELLTPAADRPDAPPTDSEPPFRATVA